MAPNHHPTLMGHRQTRGRAGPPPIEGRLAWVYMGAAPYHFSPRAHRRCPLSSFYTRARRRLGGQGRGPRRGGRQAQRACGGSEVLASSAPSVAGSGGRTNYSRCLATTQHHKSHEKQQQHDVRMGGVGGKTALKPGKDSSRRAARLQHLLLDIHRVPGRLGGGARRGG